MQDIIHLLSVNWPMSIALLIVLTLIFMNEIQHLRNKGKEISPQEAVRLMNNENAIVIDIRDLASFENCRILNAEHAKPEDFSKTEMDRYKNKNLIIVCQRGVQASSLVPKLQKQGFHKSYVLEGGMTAWQNAQLPISKGK